MLHDSVDPLVKSVQPAIRTGWKWDAVETAESSLKMKEVIGSVATGRAGLGLHPQRWWSKETTKNKQRMVSEEIHHFEESKHLTIAVVQPTVHGLGGKTPRQDHLMERHQTNEA